MVNNNDERNTQKAEIDLNSDNNYFNIISNYLDCLVVILDWQGIIIYTNSFVEKLTGLHPEKAKCRNYWDIFCLSEE